MFGSIRIILRLRVLPFIFFILFPAALVAQTKISEVKFIGNSAFSDADLSKAFQPLGFSVADTSRVWSSISQLLADYYASGYLLCKVDSFTVSTSRSRTNADLTIFISQGPQLLVGRIVIFGARFFSESQLVEDLDIHRGYALDQSQLESGISYLLTKYNDAGFPLAKISIDSLYIYRDRGADSLGIALTLNEGKRVRIEAIRIEGNTETKEYVILRALRIPAGSFFNEHEMTLARQRLQNLGFFQSVSEPELFQEGDTTGVLVRVAEGNTNTFDGVIGYVPAQAGQSGYFTGMIDISMQNLFGTGRKFSAHWNQETTLTQQLSIGYEEPYIFGYPANADLSFSQRQQDSTSVTRNFEVDGIFMFNDDFNANVSLSTVSTTPLLQASSNYSVYESGVLNLGIGVIYDTRDNIYSPTRGILYQTQIQFGQKKIYGPSELITPGTRLTNYTQHVSVGLSFFNELVPRQVMAIGLHGEQVSGTGLDQTDMYRIGGTNTIRGYLENQFIASKAAWTNIEYRFLTGRESFLFGFFDLGYIYSQADPLAHTPAISFSLYGYGVGAQVETGLGILKASFALAKGESFVDGKISFGIVNQF